MHLRSAETGNKPDVYDGAGHERWRTALSKLFEEMTDACSNPATDNGRTSSPRSSADGKRQDTNHRPAPADVAGPVVASPPEGGGELQQVAPVTSGLVRAIEEAKKKQGSPARRPTDEQQAGIDLVKAGAKVVVMEAGAGCGKTSAMVMLAEALPQRRGQYTSFVRALVDDAKTKFPVTCSVDGIHQLAFRAEGKRFQHRLNKGRVRSSEVADRLGMEDVVFQVRGKDGTLKDHRMAAGFLAAWVLKAVRTFCQSSDLKPGPQNFRYLDGIDLPEDGKRTYANNDRLRDTCVPFLQMAWKDLCHSEGSLPFQHDVYVKLWSLNHPVISADYILVDEAQDLDPVMMSIISQQRAQVVVIGDSSQQIFEWRGAVDALKAFPDAPRCYLSQSFRFGPAIAEVANMVLAELGEPTKLRLKGLPSIASELRPLEAPTAILTRTNAQAVGTLLQAIRDKKRCYLVGGGADVVAFVEGAKALKTGRSASCPELACFSNWAEVEEYAKEDEGEDLRLMVKLIKEFGCDPILDALRNMPEEKDAELVVSTCHKAKGREWDTVQLAPDFPARDKCEDADLKLLYVGLTRARYILDVSRCPYFTGQGSLDVSSVEGFSREVVVASSKPQSSQGPPTVDLNHDKDPTKFTWKRDGERWLIRGPKNRSVGEQVDVHKRSGPPRKERLGEFVKDDGNFSIYQKGSD